MLALLAAAAVAAPAADSPLIGRYAVRNGARTVCTLTLLFEPSVGGEVETSKDCVAPLADAARWYADGKGGFTLHDPLRKQVAAVVEDESGYTLTLGARRFALARLGAPRMRTDAERAAGWWSVRTADPAKVDCRIELRPGGRVGPAACAPVRPYGGGRWTADGDGVRLTSSAGQTLAFRWGDAVSLLGPRGTVLLTHD